MKESIVAAIDLGSNSFHLAIVAVTADRKIRTVARFKEMIRLGEVVVSKGFLDQESVELAVETVRRFVDIARSFNVEATVAMATAAFREAENGPEVIEAINEATGVGARVISGHEEAEIIFHAIRSACHIGSLPACGADLGGGSLELMVGDQRQLLLGRSLRLGVGRLKIKFPVGDPPDKNKVRELRQWLKAELAPVLRKIADYAPTKLILTSGTFMTIGKLALSEPARDELDDFLLAKRVTDQSLRKVCQGIVKASRAYRLDLVDEKRVDTVLYGAVILEELLGAVGAEEVWLCTWALREGMVLKTLEEDNLIAFEVDPTYLRDSSVEFLIRKYEVDIDHVVQVSRLADMLFVGLSELLGLLPEHRELLRAAALLHDIGNYVEAKKHDLHGAYLFKASPPQGFSLRELGIIETVIASHTKGDPRIPEELPETDVNLAVALTAMVRVADALDRSHQQLVEAVVVDVSENRIRLSIQAKSSGDDLSAEGFALRKKTKLLASLLDTELECVFE